MHQPCNLVGSPVAESPQSPSMDITSDEYGMGNREPELVNANMVDIFRFSLKGDRRKLVGKELVAKTRPKKLLSGSCTPPVSRAKNMNRTTFFSFKFY